MVSEIPDARRYEPRCRGNFLLVNIGPLSEYLGIGTPIVTKITSGQIAKAIRNLTPGTAPGPDGFHAEFD
jgi:hypothetical protein